MHPLAQIIERAEPNISTGDNANTLKSHCGLFKAAYKYHRQCRFKAFLAVCAKWFFDILGMVIDFITIEITSNSYKRFLVQLHIITKEMKMQFFKLWNYIIKNELLSSKFINQPPLRIKPQVCLVYE